MEQWYLDNLVCPVDKSSLEYKDGELISSSGRKYPVVDGVPVMLVDNKKPTLPHVTVSLEVAQRNKKTKKAGTENLYLETLGLKEKESDIIQLIASNDSSVDPVVSYIIAATNGIAYKDLIGKVPEYPIPELRLPDGHSELLLDVGCSWGRWSIAAARKGYTVIGLDPILGSVMAAKRVAEDLGLPIKHVVGDARYLPFQNTLFDHVFSYSVLQHLSKIDVEKVLWEIDRVLNINGESLIQMPNFLGIRSLQHQLKRKFREANAFEVRYWSVPELKRVFKKSIGNTSVSVDCYFGLGLQKNDIKYMPMKIKIIIGLSEILRKISTFITPMKYLADSVYVRSEKKLQ